MIHQIFGYIGQYTWWLFKPVANMVVPNSFDQETSNAIVSSPNNEPELFYTRLKIFIGLAMVLGGLVFCWVLPMIMGMFKKKRTRRKSTTRKRSYKRRK